MKFAPNRLYIEEYVKCTNCGVLIYDERGKDRSRTIVTGGKTYCSQWCVDWEHRARREPRCRWPRCRPARRKHE